MVVRLGLTVIDAEISVFHRLLGANGTKPFRLPSCPTLIPAHVSACANALSIEPEA